MGILLHRTDICMSQGTKLSVIVLTPRSTHRQEPAVDPLRLAQPNRPVSGMDGQWRASAIHLSMNLRPAEGAFHADRHPQADMPVPGRSVYVCLKIAREHQVNTAIARPNGPAPIHFRPRQYSGIHTPVACLDIERLKPAANPNMAITRIGVELAVPFQLIHSDASVVRMQADRPGQRVCLH